MTNAATTMRPVWKPGYLAVYQSRRVKVIAVNDSFGDVEDVQDGMIHKDVWLADLKSVSAAGGGTH